MKKIFAAVLMLVTAMSFNACMDGDWDAPDFAGQPPYGNNAIDTTSNIVTIAELKAMYPKYAENYTCTEMTKDAKLKVYVTGNDIQGNLYNSIAVQDKNGDALIIAISESSLFGYLPVGQELIIDTKGLYIGGYGLQPQIGTPYTNSSGSTYVSRMNSSIWATHFRLLSMKHAIQTKAENAKNPIAGAYVIPEYTASQLNSLDKAANAGKLMTVTGVQIDGANGTKTWANSDDAGSYTSVTLYIKGTQLEVYTSTYCDFANNVIPTGTMNLTGIWKRYNNYWELILRSTADIQEVK